jgi:hypothetical protein
VLGISKTNVDEISKRVKAAAEEPPSGSCRAILFRSYPHPGQEDEQAERWIGTTSVRRAGSGRITARA